MDTRKQLRQILSVTVAFAAMGMSQAFAYSYTHPAITNGEPLAAENPGVPITVGGEVGSLTPKITHHIRLIDVSPDQFTVDAVRRNPIGTVFYHIHDENRPFLLFINGIYEDASVFTDVYREAYAAGYNVATVKLDPDADFIANGHLLAGQLSVLRQQVPGIDGRLVLIGHSMGGLDAYVALGDYRPLDAAALISLGTPWGGSPLANLLNRVVQLPPDSPIPATLFGAAADRSLTPAKVRQEVTALHSENPTLRALRVVSVVGSIPSADTISSPFLRAGYAALSALGYPANDGAVPAPAQQYPFGGTTIQVSADHNGYVRWNRLQPILVDILHLPAPAGPSETNQPPGTLTTIAAREASRPNASPLRPAADPLQDLLNRLAIFEYDNSALRR
ncbi:hypothetical protein CVV65_02870 [Kyrpidia spormannii]|uniref:Alpha/beta hydrolase n=1 Tax=Kyrpidia spormannii TaxID=2055160 RepID=A0A2K8N4F7_9BACL|nr:alpha/beta hydrolase [Kyrpidia spormannii]ATY84025.1 hypothetical protein CVV65_02870 [Kyrpidia spormannii]